MKLTDRQTHTVLAALRYWQRESHYALFWDHNIASNGGECLPLTPAEIDQLCEALKSNDPEPDTRA